MAVTQFAFVQVGVGFESSNIPVPVASSVTSEHKTPSASNQQTTATVPTGLANPMCRVSTDTAVYVKFGSNPDATVTGARFYLPANAVEYFLVKAGEKAAVVAA